eukprot:375410-Pyramimonas_sp.AAC.1
MQTVEHCTRGAPRLWHRRALDDDGSAGDPIRLAARTLSQGTLAGSQGTLTGSQGTLAGSQ